MSVGMGGSQPFIDNTPGPSERISQVFIAALVMVALMPCDFYLLLFFFA